MIRPAKVEDLDALMTLAEQMHRESPVYRTWSFVPGKVGDLLLRLMNGGGCLLVAELDGLVAGGIAGVCTEHWFSREKIATDLALFVHRERRNGTTALRLLHGFCKWAEVMGARQVSLGITTGVHPEATGRLYAAAGLEPSGQIFSKGL